MVTTSFALMVLDVFWLFALLVWLAVGYFAVRRLGRPARIARNVGVSIWLAVTVLIGYSEGRLFLLDEPLVVAASHGQANRVESLLRRGASPNAMTFDHCPAIVLAAGGGYTQVVRELIEHGVDVNAKGESEHTALYYAKDNNYTEIVGMLKKAGARE